jgi:hypothetical protein
MAQLAQQIWRRILILLKIHKTRFMISVARLTLLYINSKPVIPAKAEIQLKNPGFRVKPGMTNKGKRLVTHYTWGLRIQG